MKLSIIVPSIRVSGVEKLYRSIDYKGEWELFIITPEVPTISSPKVKYITSYRSPNACQQQGLEEAKGDFITFASDDGEFIPGALSEAMLGMRDSHISPGNIIVGKYLEGDNPNPDMKKEDYYKFGYHKAYRIKGVPQDNLIFNCGIILRRFMLELGGWDCRFQATTCAHADLGIRASMAGANMILMNHPLFKCSHQPGKTGDHKPIHEAMKKDLKTFKIAYSGKRQTNIELDNWKNTPEVWERFK